MVHLAQAWAGVLVVFEIVAVARRYALGQELQEIMPLHGGHPTLTESHSWAFIALLLACIRLGPVFHPNNKGVWFVTAVSHTFEACVYTWWAFVFARTLPTDVSKFDVARHAQPALIYSAIVFNALWFTYTWVTTPATVPATANNKLRRD